MSIVSELRKRGGRRVQVRAAPLRGSSSGGEAVKLILRPPTGHANWSGYADFAIVVQVVDSEGDGVPGALIELVNAETSTYVVEQSTTTDALGFAMLTHRFQAGGAIGDGWRKTKIGVHQHFVRATVDGLPPMEDKIGRHMPREFTEEQPIHAPWIVFKLER